MSSPNGESSIISNLKMCITITKPYENAKETGIEVGNPNVFYFEGEPTLEIHTVSYLKGDNDKGDVVRTDANGDRYETKRGKICRVANLNCQKEEEKKKAIEDKKRA